jgi:hypothetical protein
MHRKIRRQMREEELVEGICAGCPSCAPLEIAARFVMQVSRSGEVGILQ